MAEDMRTAFTDFKPVQTIASINTAWTKVLIPSSTHRITVGCKDKDLYLAFGFAEEAASSATGAAFIAAGNYFEMNLQNRLDEFVIASQVGTASNVVVILEQN